MDNTPDVPAERHVMLAGQEITIRPMKLGALAAFMKILAGIPPARLAAVKNGDPDAVTELAFEYPDEVIEAAAVAASVAPEVIRDADVDEFIGLLADLVMLNAMRFSRHVLPALTSARLKVSPIELLPNK